MAESDEHERAVPRFARAFPRDAALDALVAAFDAGDFARVRRDGAKLAKEAESEEVRRAAATLVERTKGDPVAGLLVAIAAILLVALSAWWIAHDGPGR